MQKNFGSSTSSVNSSANPPSPRFSLGIFLRILRVNLAFLIISALWGLIGIGFLSLPLGLVFLLWSLLVGPIVITLTLLLLARPLFRMSRLSFKKEPALQREYLECLLKRDSLNLQIWVRPSQDLGLFWWEGGISGTSKTHLVVTTRWLQESNVNKQLDFRILWSEISRLSRSERVFRSYKMMLWWGPASLFDFFLVILRAVLETFNFSDFPSPAFWMQRFSWALHSFAYGSTSEMEILPRVRENAVVSIPRAWNYVFFGVWMRYPGRYLHPTWVFFASSSAFIFGDEDLSSHS